jgi:hypothetical protein
MSVSHPATLRVATLCALLSTMAFTAGTGTAQAQPQGKPPAPAAAPPGAAGVGAPPPGAAVPRYDKTTETTLKGPIVEVKLVDTPSGVQGTHLMLRQGQQMIEVFVGPTVYLNAQGMNFAKAEAIEVIGSKVQINGASALLARQIKKGDKSFAVRDENGRPAWAKKQP